jgi:hypothetical protein
MHAVSSNLYCIIDPQITQNQIPPSPILSHPLPSSPILFQISLPDLVTFLTYPSFQPPALTKVGRYIYPALSYFIYTMPYENKKLRSKFYPAIHIHIHIPPLYYS